MQYQQKQNNSKHFLGLKVHATNNKLFSDILFFIITFVLPGSFFALIDQKFFYFKGLFDLKLLCWVLTLPYLFLYSKNLKKLLKDYTAVKILIFLICYILIRFFFTIISGQSIKETFTIFRTFYSPISAIALLCYIYTMDKNRIYRYFVWIICAGIVQGFFFILYYATGFNIFAAKVYLETTFEGKDVQRYFAAMPRKASIVYQISLIQYFQTRGLFWFIPFTLMIISILLIATRSSTITIFISLLLLFFFYFKTNILRFTRKSLIFMIFAIIFYLSFTHFFSVQYNYLSSRMVKIFEIDLNSGTGNFEFRINLIKHAMDEIAKKKLTMLFGIGYKRVAEVGGYDYVLGGDSNIPGVLYAEGIVGLFLRLLIIMNIFYNTLGTYLKNSTNKANIIILISTLLIFINIVQTSGFRYVDQLLLGYFMFIIFGKEDRRKQHAR